MKKLITSLVLLIAVISNCYAKDYHNVIIDGICYDLSDRYGEAEVMALPNDPSDEPKIFVTPEGYEKTDYSHYAGDVIIPSTVEYNGNIYNVTSIWGYAFYGCPDLTSVTFPSTLEFIADYAFWYCPKLKTISIPASVVDLDTEAFRYMVGLENYIVDSGNPKYSAADGLLYNKDKTRLRYFPATREGHFVIPETVTHISSYAFEGSNLTSINVPQTVTSLGVGVFQSSKLISVALNMGKSASGVYGIEAYTFRDCKNLKEISFSETVCYVKAEAFYGCTSLEKLVFPEGLAAVYEDAIWNCESLSYIDFPSTLKRLETQIFSESLKTVVCRALEPPLTYPQHGSYRGVTIYVPKESIERYSCDDYYTCNYYYAWDIQFSPATTILPLEDFVPPASPDNPDDGSSDVNELMGNVNIFNVYDITGRRILQTDNSDDLKKLTPGLYIINGKKYLIK